jgi:hypothetical protein
MASGARRLEARAQASLSAVDGQTSSNDARNMVTDRPNCQLLSLFLSSPLVQSTLMQYLFEIELSAERLGLAARYASD